MGVTNMDYISDISLQHKIQLRVQFFIDICTDKKRFDVIPLLNRIAKLHGVDHEN